MLYLFPNLLDETLSHEDFLPPTVAKAVSCIDGIIAESEKSARAFLKRFSYDRGRTFRDIPIRLLNEHTKKEELHELIKPLLSKETWGLISDCGLPCVADPGANLVSLAKKKKIEVKAFSGPSSIFLTLMLSGIVSQSFCFHGYLPREQVELEPVLKSFEVSIAKEQMTHVFIEAPYRNQKLLETILATVSPNISLCVACDLTLQTEIVETKQVALWKKEECALFNKKPAVFVLGKSLF